MGFFKDLIWGVNELITLGGQSELERANERYLASRNAYDQIFSNVSQLRQTINDETSLLGESIIAASKKLKLAKNLIAGLSEINFPSKVESTFFEIQKMEDFYRGYSHAVVAGVGATIGSTLAVGSWALVSVVGTASTGASIAGLSGVAATNATLAWFGGGSLAAGGAGMAGGATVLGGVLLVPLVYFVTKKSYRKAKEIDSVTDAIKAETEILSNMHSQLSWEYAVLHLRTQAAIPICKNYISTISSFVKELRPLGLISQLKEILYRVARRNPFSEGQLMILKKIKDKSDKFIDSLNSIDKFIVERSGNRNASTLSIPEKE